MIDRDLNVDAYANWLYSLSRALEEEKVLGERIARIMSVLARLVCRRVKNNNQESDLMKRLLPAWKIEVATLKESVDKVSNFVGGYTLLLQRKPEGLLIFIPNEDQIQTIEHVRKMFYEGKVNDLKLALEYPALPPKRIIEEGIKELTYKYSGHYSSLTKEPLSFFSPSPEMDRQKIILEFITDLATYDFSKHLFRQEATFTKKGSVNQGSSLLEVKGYNGPFISEEYENKALSVMLEMNLIDQNHCAIFKVEDKGSSILMGVLAALSRKKYFKDGVSKARLFTYMADLIKLEASIPKNEYPIANEIQALALTLL